MIDFDTGDCPSVLNPIRGAVLPRPLLFHDIFHLAQHQPIHACLIKNNMRQMAQPLLCVDTPALSLDPFLTTLIIDTPETDFVDVVGFSKQILS
jgi:hypothetical protein